jgi:hypothetical protein
MQLHLKVDPHVSDVQLLMRGKWEAAMLHRIAMVDQSTRD